MQKVIKVSKADADRKIKVVSKHLIKKHQKEKRKELENSIEKYGDEQ